MKKISDDIPSLLRDVPLFAGTNRDILEREIANGSFLLREYGVGQIIYSPQESERRMIIFSSGKAAVYSADTTRSVLLRTVERGHILGVANLFSRERFVSRVIAERKCQTVEISAEKFGRILECDSTAMHNYLSFLSEKICFLNKKIVCLTAGSAERKLAFLLSELAAEKSSDSFELPMPMNALAEILNLGRASLYRAADKLEYDGFIKRDGKNIILTNKDKMLGFYS